MTVVRGNDLRDVEPGESVEMPDALSGQGFELQPRTVKVFKPTGAPVYFYDVITDGPERVGIASLVLEKDPGQVADCGHACANLSEGQTDPDLLSRVATRLIAHGFEKGLPKVRVVVPAQDEKSKHACTAQTNMCAQDCFECDGKEFVGYDYTPSGD